MESLTIYRRWIDTSSTTIWSWPSRDSKVSVEQQSIKIKNRGAKVEGYGGNWEESEIVRSSASQVNQSAEFDWLGF